MGKRDTGRAGAGGQSGEGGNGGHAGAGLSSDAGLAVDEAAAHAGVSDRTIRRALKARPGTAGHLPSWRVKGPRGSEYRISPVEVDLWMGRRDALDALNADGEDGHAGTLDSADMLTRPPVQSAGVQVIIEQLMAPLVEANKHQATELARLQEITRQQAEALGRERHRAEVAEHRADQLERWRRHRPWWVRLLSGE